MRIFIYFAALYAVESCSSSTSKSGWSLDDIEDEIKGLKIELDSQTGVIKSLEKENSELKIQIEETAKFFLNNLL